jgi:POT family proton-dependent oligopeptide transporter
MLIATLVFWAGRHDFAHIPARGSEFIRETFSSNGLNTMGKLMVIYLMVAMFWALFDQTASKWVFQAEQMDRNFLGIEWLSFSNPGN